MPDEIPRQQLDQLRGAGLRAISLDPHRTVCRFDLYRGDEGQCATLVLAGIQYSRFEFEEMVEHEAVKLVSIEAEPCPVGTRVFGELSNGTFELVCTAFRVERGLST